MAKLVLDASAALAYLKGEPGVEKLSPEILSEAANSTVNLAEVQSVLARDGLNAEHAWTDASTVASQIEPFSAEQAKLAGSLIAPARSFGLSLGDRACLALALTLDVPVYTADRSWKDVKVGCRIHIIR